MKEIFDFAIIGAGASGLFALQGLKDKKVIILEGNKKIGMKLLATGGGKCNFTNNFLSPENFISHNPHFVKSFLAKFPTTALLDIINRHEIPFEERDNGKLFTLSGAQSLLDALLQDGKSSSHTFKTETLVRNVTKEHQEDGENLFCIETSKEKIFAQKVIVASGGLSYPQLGATNIASKIAKNFGIKVFPLLPALAGIRYPKDCQFDFSSLSGIAITAKATIDKKSFTDQLLFTHRGFSGPLALNLSLFMQEEARITFDFIPQIDCATLLQKEKSSKKNVTSILANYIPKSLVRVLLQDKDYNLAQLKKAEAEIITKTFNHCNLTFSQLDGFDRAEVTKGGICVDELFPKTMESKKCPGLYFLGEALDVTGMLGGYNLHWAFASAKMFIDGLK